GEYGESKNSGLIAGDKSNMATFLKNKGTFYGIGLQQEVDAAAMELYIGWRHFEADLTDNTGAILDPHDVETVYTGARIKF
ncbi:MAG TPA: hypothetical protein P5114_04940, partial [Hyphomicrobiaceae bacterium]|nr:hypothetical protein [Hyphomicrobiaceae bacterium]